MAEVRIVQIGLNLHNFGKATHIELAGKVIKIDYGNNQKLIDHVTEALAADTLALIDAAIEAAIDNNDYWYTSGNERFHVGSAVSVEKRDVGVLGSNRHALAFNFDNTIKELKFETTLARNTAYSDIKTLVEAGNDAALWVESAGTERLINFDSVAMITRTNDTQIRIEHSGGGIDNIVTYPDKTTLDSDMTSWSSDVSVATVSVTSATEFIEGLLDGIVLEINLVNDTFVDNTLSLGNFTMNNAPTGLTTDSVVYVDENTARLTLVFDGTDMTTDVTNFSIIIAAAELVGASILTTVDITLGAALAIITASPAMTETNLDGSTVVVTLTNETYISNIVIADFTLNNAPVGTTIGNIERVSDTVVNVILAFDATDFDVDVTTFNITSEASGINGAFDVVSDDLTITAIIE